MKNQETADDAHIHKIVESIVNNEPVPSSIAGVFHDPVLEEAMQQGIPDPNHMLKNTPIISHQPQIVNHQSELHDQSLLRAALDVLVEPAAPSQEMHFQTATQTTRVDDALNPKDHHSNLSDSQQPQQQHQLQHQHQGQLQHQPHHHHQQQQQQQQQHYQQQQQQQQHYQQQQQQQQQDMYYATREHHSEPSIAPNVVNLNAVPTANTALHIPSGNPMLIDTRQQGYHPPQPSNQTQDQSSTQSHQGPIFVNAKQYHRILKRRDARRRFENYFSKKRKNMEGYKRMGQGVGFVHVSRHKHAMKRPRGPKGRFLTKEELVEYYKLHPEEDPNL